jgi:hypothetical protein
MTDQATKVMDLKRLRLLLDGATPLGPLVVTAGTIQELLASHDRLRAEVERLRANAIDWIRVEDRLPEAGRDVLVFFNADLGGCVDIASLCHAGRGWDRDNPKSLPFESVSHWAELKGPAAATQAPSDA